MAKKLPKPYKEGDGWAFRLRRGTLDVYKSNFTTRAAARKEMMKYVNDIDDGDKPALMGPFKTSVGGAFTDYARERLPFLKGARQEANRINRYLRHLNLPVIRLEKAPASIAPVKEAMRGKVEAQQVYFVVSFEQEQERAIAGCLAGHRAALEVEGAKTDALRAKIARTAVADVGAHDMQAFVNQMVSEGFGASSVHLEVSVLRQLFTHARKVWLWPRPVLNPAAGLAMPKLGEGRDRVMSQEEWKALSVPLARYDNDNVLPLVSLMLDSAVRSCEPLTILEWQHVDWERGVLNLPDGKGGARGVPMNVDAIRILRHMQQLYPKAGPNDLVFNTTYSAVSKAWRVACKEAGITGLKPHDSRHTSATRYTMVFGGDIPVLKVITGHKTTKMLERYVNLTSEQVALLMRGEELPDKLKPAGFGESIWDTALAALNEVAPDLEARTKERSDAQRLRRAAQLAPKVHPFTGSNVIRVDFQKRAA